MKREDLISILNYDSITGVFYWKKANSKRIKVGDIAGYINPEGYRIIRINGKNHRAHRLAWLIVHRASPICQIDHKNGNRSDNRIDNLRDVSGNINQQNTRKAKVSNSCGFLGVTRKKTCYQTSIYVDKKRIHLGSFHTAEEAYLTYIKAKRKLHPGNTL